jgi:hypothetical protein
LDLNRSSALLPRFDRGLNGVSSAPELLSGKAFGSVLRFVGVVDRGVVPESVSLFSNVFARGRTGGAVLEFPLPEPPRKPSSGVGCVELEDGDVTPQPPPEQDEQPASQDGPQLLQPPNPHDGPQLLQPQQPEEGA